MATNAKPVYKRILLKLSGSSAGYGRLRPVMHKHTGSYGSGIKNWLSWVFEVRVVIGGGKTCSVARVWQKRRDGHRVVGDHMGMLVPSPERHGNA